MFDQHSKAITKADSKSSRNHDKHSKPSRYVFFLSSKDKSTTFRMVENMSAFVRARQAMADDHFIARLAYTLGQRRSLHPWAVAVSAASSKELMEGLRNIKPPPVRSNDTQIGFIFTGQGYGRSNSIILEAELFR
jgi:acyl transferase domain-containing protein